LNDDARIRDFVEFRAETRLELAYVREALARLRPIEDARSGERAEREQLVSQVSELRKESAETRAEIKQANAAADARMDRLEDRQKRTLAIMLGVSVALQVVGGLLLWAFNAGVLQLGGGPP
jgi:hypothetical protein